ncbi:MAG: acetylglutamate kinase [Spirochaetota bacterium]
MDQYIEKANILIEALPYIKRFYGKTVVVKYGGSAMTDEAIKDKVIEDIVLMKLVGMKPVIVHGGGNAITATLKRMGIQSDFVDGMRVTDKETAEVAEMVLSGSISKKIVQTIQNHGINAVGINGKDANTFQAVKRLVNGKDVGFVGEITAVRTQLVDSLIASDFIPVIAPVGTDAQGNTYNINADFAASAIAGALQAEKLVFLTDIEGILKDVQDKSSIIRRISAPEARKLINEGVIAGGMIPKTLCCIDGIEKGVRSVHILDGRLEHSMLLEIFTNKGIGTMITPQEGYTSV